MNWQNRALHYCLKHGFEKNTALLLMGLPEQTVTWHLKKRKETGTRGNNRCLPCSWDMDKVRGRICRRLWWEAEAARQGQLLPQPQRPHFSAVKCFRATTKKFFPYLLLISNCLFTSRNGKHWSASPGVPCFRISNRQTFCSSQPIVFSLTGMYGKAHCIL